VVACLNLRAKGSILPGTFCNLWLTWLLFSALASSKDKCNTVIDSGWASFIQIISHLIWTFTCLFGLSIEELDGSSDEEPKAEEQVDHVGHMGALQAKNEKAKTDLEEVELSSQAKEGGRDEESKEKEGGTTDEEEKEKPKKIVDEEEGDLHVYEVSKFDFHFQLVLIIAACHFSMVLTNWGNPVVNNTASDYFSQNDVSFGIKISMWALSFVVYLAS